MSRVQQAWKAGEFTASDSPTITLPMVVKDVGSEEAATIALLAGISDSYLLADGTVLYLQSAGISERIGESIWGGKVNYGKKPPADRTQEVGSLRIRFRSGGQTETIKVARFQAKYPVLTAPDPKGGINSDNQGIRGVAIFIPNFEWDEIWNIPTDRITKDYLNTIASMTPRVNNTAFRGFAAGEVLFKYLEGEAELGKKFSTLTFHFAQSPNKTNFKVGDITVARKDGWEYMEIASEVTVSNQRTIATPSAVYIDTVYELGDYSRFGIGS